MYFTKDTINQLPPNPGIYKMIDDDDVIIYIGKAKHLKNRVKSYFSKRLDSIKTKLMVAHIARIEIIETRTEKEAFILENQLIKTFKPKYNILLKDDKTFPYIKVTTQEPFPRIIVTRHKQQDGATYYGPFPSMGSSRSLKKTLYDLFPIRDCKQSISLTSKEPKCLLLDIDKCVGPCVKKDIKPIYDDLVTQLDLLLTGRNSKLLSLLKKDMKSLSNNHKFEQASTIRDRIILIEKLTESQRVALDDSASYSIWAFVESNSYYYIMVQELIDGKLISQHGFYDEKRYVTAANFIEKTFLAYTNDYIDILNSLICSSDIATVLNPLLNHVNLPLSISPERGLKKDLLDNVTQNAHHALQRLLLKPKKSSNESVLMSLKKSLQLTNIPKLIFGFDISHLQGSNIVASAVAFKNGSPFKNAYRKFSITSPIPTSNDPKSIQEVVYRRLKYCLDKKEPLPDLLLIDGGKAQLNFAFSSLCKLGLEANIDLIALAKKNEDIYRINHKKPLRLPHNNAMIHLLQYIRDESHRFALSFQRHKRHKLSQQSQLLQIEGLGKQRLKALYQRFDSLNSIKQASVQDIASIPRIGLKLATLIHDTLRTL
tara:strand:- start:3208 stop:5004 length:1797 start_codon:yes stop_codon:yes gene_type:complete